jgi:hypothetical protein
MLASSLDLGKADVLTALADSLSGYVRQAAQEGRSLDEVERGVFAQVLDMGKAAVELFLDGQGDGDLGDSVTTEDGTVLGRSETLMPRPLRTIFGEHCLHSYVYSQGSKQKIELRPIDARINLPEGKASYLVQEFSQMFCVEKAFRVGAQQFQRVFRQRLSVDVLEEGNRTMGEQADRFLDSLPPPPRAATGTILVTTADSKGVPLVRDDAAQVPVFDKKERPGNRRMATLGCVYTVAPHVRTPEQIVAALFRETTLPQPEDRPEPQCKRYRGYFAEATPENELDISGSTRAWLWITEEVMARHRRGQPIIRLMDGQPSLWDVSDDCLDDFIEELREHRELHLLVDILDIIHVSGYVWRAAKALYSHKEQQEAFAQDRLLRILCGDVRGVITGMRRMASQRSLTGQALDDVLTTCNYFEKNAGRMRYDEYLRQGYPIATGVIEGACRHVIKDRMEQGGMRWTLDGAEAMLNVRSVCASSEWETFGSWRQAEEAKRVHPHRSSMEKYSGFKA